MLKLAQIFNEAKPKNSINNCTLYMLQDIIIFLYRVLINNILLYRKNISLLLYYIYIYF